MAETDGRWPSRQEAEDLLFEFTQGDALRRHGRAVEEAMRAYAGWFGVTDPAEVERWGVVGLLHDFDYEQNPTEDRHLHVGGGILRERGYDEEMVSTIESHANYMNVPRVDRCMTCHRAIDRPGFESKKEAARLARDLQQKLDNFQIQQEKRAEIETQIAQLKRTEDAPQDILNPWRTHPKLDTFVACR